MRGAPPFVDQGAEVLAHVTRGLGVGPRGVVALAAVRSLGPRPQPARRGQEPSLVVELVAEVHLGRALVEQLGLGGHDFDRGGGAVALGAGNRRAESLAVLLAQRRPVVLRNPTHDRKQATTRANLHDLSCQN